MFGHFVSKDTLDAAAVTHSECTLPCPEVASAGVSTAARVLGSVAPGKLADLMLLDADPLVAITNTTTIRAVVANGRYFDRNALDSL